MTDQPKLETVQLDGTVDKIARSLKTVFPEKECHIEIDVGGLALHTDRNALETVLRNLIGNAVKFSYPGGRIRVSAQEAKRGRVVISIADEGVGVPDALRDRLFDVEEKTSTPGTAGELGTGLGLPLCRELLDKIGEDIWLEPSNEQGTTVSFTVEKQPS